MPLLLPSYSTLTVYDIRCAGVRKTESNQGRITRLAKMYGLSEVDVRVLMAADDDFVDIYGRIAERAK